MNLVMYHRREYYSQVLLSLISNSGAPEASMDIVKEAAEIAQATEFIEN